MRIFCAIKCFFMPLIAISYIMQYKNIISVLKQRPTIPKSQISGIILKFFQG